MFVAFLIGNFYFSFKLVTMSKKHGSCGYIEKNIDVLDIFCLVCFVCKEK